MFRPVIRSFSLLTSRQKLIFGGIVFSRILVHALDVAGLAAIGLLGAMLASGLTDQTEAQFLGYQISIESSETYLWVTLVVAVLFITKSAIGSGLLRLTTLFLARVEARSASEVARYLFSGDISRVRQMSKGEIQWAVGQSSNLAFSSMLFGGSVLVTESALFVAVFAAFLFVDVSTALIIGAYFLVLIALFQLSINQRLRRLGRRLAQHSVVVNNSILDMTVAFREATVLEKRGVFLERFDFSRRRTALDQGLARFVMGLPRFYVEAGLMVGIMGLIVWQFARGTLSEGLVIVGIFLAGGTRMMAAMLPLQNAITDLRINGPQAEKAQELITRARADATSSRDTEYLPSTEEVPLQSAGLPVSLRQVTFRYPDANEAVINELSLEISSGAFAAFVGPSGAGKTTLADLILGIHEPNAGEVLVGGLAPDHIRKLLPGIVAYVPQSPGMVSGTLAENVALGVAPAEIDIDRVQLVLGQAGLTNLLESLPDGVHSSLGEQADALSGGQIQRLGIARALYSKPRLLVLDEATSALDAETEADVAKTIEGLRGETTLIVIAHRLSTIQRADEVFVTDGGDIVASGTFPQVRRKVPMIERYVQLMAIRDDDGAEHDE